MLGWIFAGWVTGATLSFIFAHAMFKAANLEDERRERCNRSGDVIEFKRRKKR